jgi:hypothetical protein
MTHPLTGVAEHRECDHAHVDPVDVDAAYLAGTTAPAEGK